MDWKRIPKHRHILATPLVDVFSVSINRNVEQAEMSLECEIYGHIRVINTRLGGDDAEPEAMSLFHRDENNPHHTYVGMPLPLNPSSPIYPSKYTQLDVLLYDRNANKMVVAQGRIVLDIKTDKYEDDYVQSVFGHEKLTFARIGYSVLHYAVAATVDVLFFSKDNKFDLLPKEEEDDPNSYYRHKNILFDKTDQVDYDKREVEDSVVADVFGSVSAFCNVTKEKRNRSISLFSKSPEKAVRVKSGDFIPLSRSLVIVPAYSCSLAVEVNLSLSLGSGNKQLASGILKFHPQYERTYKEDFDDGEHGRIRVRVTWNHAYDQQLYHEKKPEYQNDVKSIRECHKIEVFSVAVHSKESTDDDFSFYGTIDAKDSNEFCMYSKDKSCPEAAGALAPLKGPRSRSFRTGDYFWLRVHLKDGTTGGEVSDGQVAWDNRLIAFWNNRRLCSVIRGDVGFAAVHYSAISDADSALVNVKLYGEQLPGYVYGKIVARYSTYEYSGAYEKKYFENILFDKHSEDDDGLLQPMLGCGSDLPLLKSLVLLPYDSDLVIEVDLAVTSQPSFNASDRQDATLLKGIVELIDDECHEQLNAKTFHVDVSMSFLSWESHFEWLS